MEKALHIFSRFVAGLVIVLTQWFRQRIHPIAYLRRLWSWRSILQSTLLLLVMSCADNVYAQIKATASLSKGIAGTRPMPGLPTGVKPASGELSDKVKQKANKALTNVQATLRFEQNQGQLGNPTVRFKAADAQATYFFTKDEIRTVINGKKDSLQAGYALQFVDANPDAAIAAADKISNTGATNYITDGGSFANVASYSKLSYSQLWQGVDASFYESEGTMKYDFIVQPNADPAQVRLKMDGATDLKVNAKGELEFTTPFGTLQKGKPYTYQTVNGKKVEITSGYVLNDKGEITFQLGEYDHTLPLVIDPIALKWSTYLMAGIMSPYDIYVHPTTGRIYLVGVTQSASFPNTLGRTYGGGLDAFVTCMEKDGTSLVWSTYIGGSLSEIAYAVSVDAAGDVYVSGSTSSTDFPVNGTTTAFDATQNGSLDIFVLRLNSTGSTLKYSTFVGGAGEDAGTFMRKLVVTNGKVYLGSYTGSTDFPTTVGAYQQSVPNSGAAVLFCLNTNVGGTAGLEFSTFFAGLSVGTFSAFTEIEEDKDGNLWLVGVTLFDPSFPISANAVQKYTDFNYTGSTTAAFVAKFSKSGQYLYSSYVNPLWSPDNGNSSWSANIVPSLDVDAQGNVYVAAATYLTKTSLLTVKKAPNILTLNELSPLSSMVEASFGNSALPIGYVAKIPYNLSPQYDFVSIFPSNAVNYYADPEIAIDKKGNIHLLTHGGDNVNSPDVYYPLTPGAVNTKIVANNSPSVYYVLPPSGSSVLYGTVLNSAFSFAFNGMFVNDKCEAYLISVSSGMGNNYPITPSYRDFETNTKKNVYNSTNNTGWALAVFHEPIPNNNTIPDFAAGNNTFCVGGLIYQNPNDGPIIGSTAGYVSGDGSSATHNIPNMLSGAHPTPASPALQYQWQKSLNGGTTWTNVGNGTFPVYKPEPESAAGTVQYRRLITGYCADTLSISNTAAATIANNIDLQITTPTKPVYYCPTVAGTDLGISVTGASGNISWQWYDGFSPLTGNGIISPSSNSGVAQGSFTAAIGTSVSASGFYRLVITDAGGCKKEAFVAIAPKTANAGPSPTMALCPGASISVQLGPTAINPDFDYSWTGPSGFVSTSPNPTVTTAGTYTLQVKLKTDAGFCAPGTTVTVTPNTPHPTALTSLTNKAFCQDDTPAPIGLSGTAPAGYVFQWVPGTNLDNQQAYNPVYDPGVVPGGPPIGTTNYTFTALRLSDGCIFESTNTVTNTALAFAFAGSNLIGDGCTTGTRDGVGGVETTGLYFQWTAIGTDFAAGLASLKANAAFGMDVVGQQMGTNKFLNAKFPLCSVNGNVGYYIDYELKASYIPFSNNCFTLDTVRVFIPCCGSSPSCPIMSSNFQGTTGACSGATSQLSFSPLQGATYTWTTYSVNGVIQPAGTAPKGLFVNNNGVKGAALAATGPHPSSVIVDFDNAAWGWLGNNVVVYEVTQTIDLGSGPQTCFSRQQVFSGLNGTPKIGVLDQALCSIAAPGIRVGTTGKSGPYQLTGASFTQAPNSAFTWTWTGGPITNGGTTPFPTVNPTSNTNYYVTVRDPETGCVAKDTLLVKVKSVVANAGADLTDICPGSLVQLGTAAQDGHSYSWSPSAGLNFPISTPNSTTAQPYLSVPNAPVPPATLTYTLIATDGETGCVATDNMTIGTATTPPPAISAESYDACPSAVLTIGPAGSLVGATYAWTLVSGGNISYLSSTSVRQPVVTLPANFTGPAIFRLTITKGTCGSVTADYTINNNNPAIDLGGPFTATCTSPFTQIGETSATGYTYSWTPYAGLYTDAALTTPYTGTSLSQVYALPTAATTYTLTRTHTASGCQQTATVVVNPPAGVAVDAGPDKFWCPGAAAVAIGSTGSGTLTWTAIGYTSSLSAATPTTIASPMTSAQMLGYLSGTSGASVNFSQSSIVSGQYVYRVTSTSGGCSVSDDIIVKVGEVLPTGIAGLGQAVCLGESVQLGATTNPTTFNYLWTALNPINAGSTISNPTAARPFVTPTVNTTYQVTYTNSATGCSADEQVTVVVNPKPVIADVTVPIVCKPVAAQNLTSLITDYGTLVNPVWYKDQYPGGVVITTPMAVAVSKTTTYYLVAENTFGCEDTAMVVINVANPTTPDITPSGSLNCATRTFDLTSIQGSPSVAGNTLEWHSANNTLATTLITNTAVGVGKYYLFEKAASPANCYSASDSITVSSNCPALCTLTLKPTVSGCYQNAGSSKATVSVEVSWENATVSPTANDSSDVIRVTFGGQTKSINPGAYTSTGGNGSIVSPQVVAFEVAADASTQTAQAFFGASYAASTCKVEKTGITLPAACPPTVCATGQTGGTVWNDFNADGVKQPGETTGLAGVTVKAYDCNGTLVATAITDAFGRYAFTGLTAASYPIRVEFSNLPTFAGQGTMNGTDGRTTTQFVNAADCNVDLGVLDPTDYCQTNPKVVIPCYTNGDPLVAGTSATSDAVVAFDYNVTGANSSTVSSHAVASQVGTIWGMAYNKFTKKVFSSATVKRHAGLGPLGLGGIYVSDFTNTPANGTVFNYTNFIDVSTIGINVGSIAGNAARGLVGDKAQPSEDNAAYLATGKIGIGGIDFSEDGNKLYLTNLLDNKLYEIDITVYNTSGTLPTASNVKSYDMSTGINCTGGNLHTWAVKVRKGKVYTGMVCDASISQNKSDLRAFVQELDGSTVSTIFDFPLTYPKGFPFFDVPGITGWYPWTDDWSKKAYISPNGTSNNVFTVYPEPIFSGIEFDIDGSMVLAFGDRTAIQSGFFNLAPVNDGEFYQGTSGGDILRAYSNGVSYVLENNAKAGPNIGYGPGNNQGPGFGEFYNDNLTVVHTENALGGLALRPGSGEVIEVAMDPLEPNSPGFTNNAGGIRHLNNTTGLVNDAFMIYTSNGNPGLFGKASGLGDAVLLCDLPTYLEIGNRVWNDTDKDGIQDPCEKVLTGVNVSLYKGTTLIATTTTDVNGEYYFSTKSKIGAGTWLGTGADTTLLPTTGYKLVFGAGQTTGGALTVAGLGQFILTVKDATANNGNDQNDSDAEVLSGAFCINLTTGSLASVNHTFDVGFICTNPAIKATFTQTAPTCTATTENNNGKVTLTAAVTPYDKFRVKLSTATWGADSSYATANAIGTTFPKDLVTTAPNAGATYVVRFYTGECCYKDTTVTVVPIPCLVGSIGDYVWKDANRNGKQDGSEAGVNGVQVILWSATTTGTPIAKLDSMTTAGVGANAGKYLFSNLPKGDYVVQFVKSTIPAECSGFTAKDTTAAGTTDTNDSDADKVTGITAKITLDPKVLSGTSTPADSLATNNLTIDAGLVAPQGSLGDFVWKDTNNNGIQDETTPNGGGVAGVQIELYKNGTLFAKDTTDAMGKYLFTNLDAGTYKIKVLSASIPAGCEISSVKDAPNDDTKDSDVDKTTGESGNYVIDPLDPTKKDILTVDAALFTPKGSLGDFVWKDTNNNGIQDETTPNGGGVAGVQIELYKVGTTAAIAKDTTDATGKYLFSNLDAGTYKIKVLSASIPAGCEISSVKDAPNDDAKDSDVDKTTGESGNYVIDPLDPTKKDILTVDAALYSPKGSLGDFVWKDTNNNGIQDETTPNGGGVAGVQIELYKNGTLFAKDTTDAMGKYLFSNLDAGTYKIKVLSASIPAGCEISSVKDAPNDDAKDSDVDKNTGESGDYVIDPLDPTKKDILTVDAALYTPKGSLGDFVWKDTNNNGIQDETTPNGGGVAGVQIELYKNGTLFAKDTTDATGKYLFSNLDAGTYKIKVLSASIPAGCEISSVKDAPSDDAKDSDVDKTTGESGDYVITPTDPTKKDILTVDAALFTPKGSLGDFVWKDTNNNGIQDETTPNGGGVAGVQIELYKNGTLFAKDTTDATGKYLFSNLDAGTYKIKVLSASIPAGCEISSVKDAPSDDAKDSDVDKTTGESGNYVIDPLDPTKKDILTVDAALFTPKGSLGDFVWKDTNNNGIQDETTANAGGVANVIIELYKNGTLLTKDTTDAQGKYLFSNLDAGTYKIKVLSASIPAGCEISSVKDAPNDDAKDSDVDKTTGESGNYVIDPLDPTKKDILTVDAALYTPKGSLGDFVWKDTNNNGIQDETTPNGGGVAGVQIELYKNGTLFAKDTTDATGKYLFSNLDAGTYKIKVLSASIPAGCEISSVKDAPNDDAKDSDVDKTTGESGNYVIDPLDPTKKDILTVDAALYTPKGSLGDFVWKDTNNNGIQDETTPNGGGVAGVQIELYKNGTLFAKDTTDATGKYLFTNLEAGTYKIKVLSASIPAGCELSSVKDAPNDDAKDSDVDKTTGESGDYVITPTDPTKKDILTVDAALYTPKGSLGDFVWKDTNNNGIQDETTPNGGGVAGVQIELYKNGTLFAKDTTDATGKYLFSNLDAGTYKIKVLSASIPAGCEISSVKDAPNDDAKDSDVDKTTGESGNYVIDPLDPTKKDILTVDAALYSPKGSLGDFVWKDTNNNGIQDETTPNGGGVAGVQIELYKNGTFFAKDTTDATGKYLFSNLDAGTYKIKVLSASILAGCEISSVKDAPSDDAKDSDVDKTTGESGNYVIDPLDPTKKDILTVDAGLAVPCVKSKVALIGTPACSADVQTYSLTFSVTGKNGTIKVNKGTLTGSNPYTVTGIPSGVSLTITDSLSAICKSDTVITGLNCNCNPSLPTLLTPSLTACIGDTFPTLKATVVGLATVEWFATATSTSVLFTGLNYKPSGTITASGAVFYARARSTDPSCPAAISTGRVMATINAQNCTVEVDLALKKSINTKIARIGDVLTYTLKVWNESNTNATGVEVVDSIATTVQFQTGSFTASRGSASITGNVIKWVIGNIAANGDTVTLTYRVKATQEGVHFNTAEICKTNEKDVDSTPCNHKGDEDDIDRQCFTVPVKLCPGEKAEVNVPANLTNVQWFKNGGSTSIASGNSVLLTEVGTYTFTATNQACPASGCCPVIIEAGVNCCPEDLCIPFTIKQTKKGKK